MDLLSVFVDSSHQVRSGMKFLSYAVVLVGLWLATAIAVQLTAKFLFPGVFLLPRGDFRFLALNGIVLFIPSVTALLVMARALDPTPIAALGVAAHDGWSRDFTVGLAVAAGMLGFTLVGSFLFGEVHMEWSGSFAAIPAFLITLAALAVSALSEELVFRGYPLQILMKGLGAWGSILLISSLFGFVHAMNPGATVLSVLGTMIAGVVLALAYLKTRSIWFPYGIHLGWNVGLSMVLGYPMSGIQTASILTTNVFGADAFLGGPYGPEAGIVGVVVFVTTGVIIHRMRTVRVSSQVRAAITTHSEKLYAANL